MDKQKLFFILLITELVLLVILFSYLYSQTKYIDVVIIEENVLNPLHESRENICPSLCEERKYSGWQGTGGINQGLTSCDCYWLVSNIPKVRINK